MSIICCLLTKGYCARKNGGLKERDVLGVGWIIAGDEFEGQVKEEVVFTRYEMEAHAF